MEKVRNCYLIKCKISREVNKLKKKLMIFIVLAIFCAFTPLTVKAAEFKQGGMDKDSSVVTIGKMKIKRTDDGLMIKRGSKPYEYLLENEPDIASFITDGKVIYFSQNYSDSDSCISEYVIRTGAYTVAIMEGQREIYLSTKYGDKLYYNALNDEDDVEGLSFYYYNWKKCNIVRIKKNYHGQSIYKNCCYLIPYSGDLGNAPLYRVDLKTGRAKKIISSRCSYFFKGNYIYYGVVKKGYQLPETLYRCSLTGKNKKRLGTIRKYYRKCIYYKTSSGKTRKISKVTPGYEVY